MRVNRRGTLEWNLETIGKLALYLVMFFFVVFMTVKIIGLFKGGEHEMRAERNLEYLTRTINGVIDGKLQGPQASVIVGLPGDYAIIGFDRRMTRAELQFSSVIKKDATVVVPRPDSCDNACVCAFSFTYDQMSEAMAFEAEKCASFDAEFIAGNHGTLLLNDVKFELNGKDIELTAAAKTINGQQYSDFVFPNGEAPVNVRVEKVGDAILLIS